MLARSSGLKVALSNISDASSLGSLVKLGSGTLTLTGTNTFGGGTTISSGALVVGDGATSGSLLGNVVDNGNLTFSRSDNITFAGSISGTGGLTQAGTGALTLSGTNSYTGATVIQSGDLVHTDIGVIYAGLYTDYQKNAYVLKPGESFVLD